MSMLQQMFCHFCGKPVRDGANYCTYCGTQIPMESQSPVPAQTIPMTSAPRPSPPPIPTYSQTYTQPPRQYGYTSQYRQNEYRVHRKDPAAAVILSFLFPGLGQLYNGESGKGVAFMFLGVLFIFTIAFFVGWFLYPVLWLAGMIDAWDGAKRSNAVQIARSLPPLTH